jgi:hypothetical protein
MAAVHAGHELAYNLQRHDFNYVYQFLYRTGPWKCYVISGKGTFVLDYIVSLQVSLIEMPSIEFGRECTFSLGRRVTLTEEHH